MEQAIQPQDNRPAVSLTPDFRMFFESAPGVHVVLLPDDPVFTIVAANDGCLRAGHVTREQAVGRGLFELFPENENADADGARNLRASFRRALTSGLPDTVPVQRYDVELPEGEGGGFEERYWSVLNTPMPGADGRIAYLLHSAQEVTGKVLAERRALEAQRDMQTSEMRFHQLAENSALGLVIGGLDGTLSYLNPTVRELLGYSADQVRGGLLRWDQLTAPGFASLSAETVRQVAASGRCAPYETVFIASDGRHIPVLVGASILDPLTGETQMACFVLDLTERKRSDRDAFQLRLEDAVRGLDDPDEIVDTAARLLRDQLQVEHCIYSTFEDGSLGADLARFMQDELPLVVHDIQNDVRSPGLRSAYPHPGAGAVAAVPLVKAGRLVAALAVDQAVPRKWQPEDVQLIQLVANRCWESVERARITRELRSSEQRLRLAQRAARVGSFEWLVDEQRVIWTPELEALYALPEAAFEGKLDGWMKRVVPEDATRVMAEIQECFAKRQTDYVYEFRAVLPDGSVRWLRGQAQFFYNEADAPVRMIGVNLDIDAQKQAEAELRQQWHTFDTALSHTPDSIYIFDLRRRLIYANRSLLARWQKTLAEAAGKNLFELGYRPEDAERLQVQMQQVIQTGQQVHDVTSLPGNFGDPRILEYTFVPVLAENGEIEAVAGSTHDITERIKAEELIEADRRRWRDLLLQAPAAIALLRGPEHRYEWVNPQYLRLVGLPAEALLGNTVEEAIPEAAEQQFIDLLDRVYRTGEPCSGYESPLRLGNAEYYINFVFLANRDTAGRIEGIFVHATDVTDLVKARMFVEESERQFRTLAESIPHLTWMADETGHIFWYNQRWYNYTGTTLEQMQGWGWHKVHDPAELPNVMEHWKRALQTGTPFERVFPLKGADGEFRSFLTRVEPVKDAEGRVVRWFGTNTDINDQLKTQEDLRKMNRELEEFAYVASHDLQEPLRMVNIYTQLILKRIGKDNADLNDYGGFVHQGVIRMEGLIRDLLTFSRTVQMNDAPTGTAELSNSLAAAVSDMRNRIEETGAVIRAGDLPTVRGDTQQLVHVFQNLISNSLKYRSPDRAPEITIATVRDGDRWVISLRDNGIGFDQKYSERIFGLFKRLHTDAYPGTGLGLAICQRIVERYGGRMWAEGRLGDGATFYFCLPAADNSSLA